MLRLTTLGALDLRDGRGHPIREVLSQPKRVALLIYLAVEGRRGPVSRDRLLALFWPESDGLHARNTLSQSLHHLRQSLGADLLESHGSTAVAFHASHLWCDATALTDALDAGESEQALDLYRGEFSPALFVAGSPEVEAWLETERRRLRILVQAVACTAAERLAQRGDRDGAMRMAKRALALFPDDEADVRALLAVLERVGDGAGALLAYQAYAKRLADDLETDAEPQTRQLIESIRTRREAALLPSEDPGVRSVPERAFAPASPRVVSVRQRKMPLLTAAAIGLAAAGAGLAYAGRPSHPALDTSLVVVAPFRVLAADTGLAFLRDGMLDLIAAKLTGDAGLRSADPRTVTRALESRTTGSSDLTVDDALAVARDLGGGRLLVGSLVGRRENVTITAQLYDVQRGIVATSATLSGPLDSLPELVDQMVARLLVEHSGEPAERLAGLMTTSLPALESYLLGRTAFRAGRYDEATRYLRKATATDSLFALAWLEYARASSWLVETGNYDAIRGAWAVRDRLLPGDRAFLVAMVGPRYPQWASIEDRFVSWENAARLTPDRPDVWYGLGDAYFHVGELAGRDTGFVRAEAAFRRAVLLDSGFTAPLEHLVQIALLRNDLPAARRYWALQSARDSTSETAVYLRWRMALAFGDSATVRRIEAAFDTIPTGVLTRIAGWALVDGVGVPTAWRAARVYLERAGGRDGDFPERVYHVIAGNLGRFAERAHVLQYLRRKQRVPSDTTFEVYYDAAIADGDVVRAGEVRAHFESAGSAVFRMSGACVELMGLLERLGPKDPAALSSLSRRCLENPPAPSYTLWIRTMVAGNLGTPDLDSLIAVIDSSRLASAGAGSGNAWALPEGIALLAHGEYARAQATFRRREIGTVEAPQLLATLLRREGFASELAGDTVAALRAYRHYLALRYDPDPGVRPWNDTVRSAIDRLEPPRDRR